MTKKDDINNSILKWALDNARKHAGRANPGAVIGKLLNEFPDMKANLKEINSKMNKKAFFRLKIS